MYLHRLSDASCGHRPSVFLLITRMALIGGTLYSMQNSYCDFENDKLADVKFHTSSV